ncbi:unnamed protein product [Schistocephalus solidus]|uniref:Ac45-VOA1_TM domain-containing protein n=1 Tax=Schistocephalus solidus TaxID=70667 RepID=A0A183SWZ2_SCHSO|nr:unnamed protein product [Schistocephalus solidus]
MKYTTDQKYLQLGGRQCCMLIICYAVQRAYSVVQPFDVVDGRFGDVNDCVGFFTPGIISNLLIVFLLLGIFSYGLSMVMGIQTNDAFDDPKSKMLQIGSTAD